jgi:hypothetical protein
VLLDVEFGNCSQDGLFQFQQEGIVQIALLALLNPLQGKMQRLDEREAVARHCDQCFGSSVPAGKIVATNSRNPNATHQFWSFDSHEGTSENLPDDLAKKYLWIGSLSPSGTKIVYANTMENGLEDHDAQNQAQ